jgi:hypothetical protein
MCGAVQQVPQHKDTGVTPKSSAGPLGEEASRQLQPLAAQLTRLDLQGGQGRDAPTAPVEVGCPCRKLTGVFAVTLL